MRIGRSGSAHDSFVYRVTNIGLAQYNWQDHGWNIRSELTTAWTSFDFPGSWQAPSPPVTVQVSMIAPSPAWKQPAVRILPSAYGVKPSAVTQVGNAYQVSFTTRSPSQYSVEFYDAATAPNVATWVPPNPLLILANPMAPGSLRRFCRPRSCPVARQLRSHPEAAALHGSVQSHLTSNRDTARRLQRGRRADRFSIGEALRNDPAARGHGISA
ncbi:MAG: hypothetical protein WBE91_04825 [Steroidobacteraceae bacterium]